MTLVWRNIVNPTMAVVIVIPVYEMFYPYPCFENVVKSLRLIVKHIFKCLEKALCIRIVIADSGPAS